MARLTILFALVLAACVLEGVRSAAVKGRPSISDPDYPQPIRPGKPCAIKNSECVPLYTEEDANRLAALGNFGQVAIMPELPPELQSRMSTKSKRKTSCRNGSCRRAQRKSVRQAKPRAEMAQRQHQIDHQHPNQHLHQHQHQRQHQQHPEQRSAAAAAAHAQ